MYFFVQVVQVADLSFGGFQSFWSWETDGTISFALWISPLFLSPHKAPGNINSLSRDVFAVMPPF